MSAPRCSPRACCSPTSSSAHAPFRKGETFEDQLGNAARKNVGNERWNTRVLKAIDGYDVLFFDHVYIGGGNAKRLDFDPGHNVEIVSNSAGILGGIKLWERHESVRHATPSS